MKTRLDVLLVEKGLFESREKARAAIMEGLIYVDGAISDKPGTQVKTEALIEIKGDLCPFVSRGGYKLQKALDVFGIDPSGMVCLDIGSSTGGFTDCLLQRGAAKVYALDVGTNQLAYKLRVDERVVCMEKTNFRTLDVSAFPEKVDFACTDVSFISLKHIFPNASALLKDGCAMVALIKPQFEAGREQVGKKGIIRDASVHEEVIRSVISYAEENGLSVQGLDHSPITGTTGNIEFLIHLKLGGEPAEYDISAVVKGAHGALEG